MKFISTKEEFNSINIVINSIADRRFNFPDVVFKKDYCLYSFFEFYKFFTEDFFDRISHFSKKCGSGFFWVSVINPDPEQYFFKNFLHYGTIECGVDDASEEYISALNKDPGKSPADAIIHNSNVVVIGSSSEDWLIWGDREFDIAVCAFRSDLKRNLFLLIFESIVLPDELIVTDLPLYGSKPPSRSG